jgi:hypothetical protein
MQNKMLDHEVSFGVEHICLCIPELSDGAHSCYWNTHSNFWPPPHKWWSSQLLLQYTQHLLTATTQVMELTVVTGIHTAPSDRHHTSDGAHSCYWNTHITFWPPPHKWWSSQLLLEYTQHLLTATTLDCTRHLIMYTSYRHIYETEMCMLFSAVGTLHEEMHHITTQNNTKNCWQYY